VAAGKLLSGAAAATIAILGVHAQSAAHDQAQAVNTTAAGKEKDLQENRRLLDALLHRRAELAALPHARAPGEPRAAESRRFALDFLDRQIAKVKAQIDE
jgi:hypothetical protein